MYNFNKIFSQSQKKYQNLEDGLEDDHFHQEDSEGKFTKIFEIGCTY